jgi:uncharacterized membrane protein
MKRTRANKIMRKRYDPEWWTANVLRLGVWTSAAFMIIGLIFAAFQPQSIIEFSANPSLGSLATRFFSARLDPVTLMFAGLVLLMFTPIMRIVAAIFGFSFEKEWRFVIVSSVVLIMLIGEIIYSISIK